MAKKRVATVWLCGCSGCHMSLLDIDEKVIDLAALADIVASPVADVKEVPECDVCIVEGGIANEDNLHILKHIRKQAKILVALGDCAGFGCVPMLRNQFPLEEVLERAYVETESCSMGEIPRENVPKLLPKVRPIHEYVKVDAFIPGCPPSAAAIWSAVAGLLTGSPAKEPVAMAYD
jgi:NAD-reducing hydrogenase small subunit